MKIMTMVRPREGGFCYADAEFATAIEDARQLLSNGTDGLVFGFLHQDGTLDRERTRILAEMAQEAGKETVFHRAIDVVPDWKEVLDVLIELGITRVLTSGQEPDVSLGTDTVREMIQYAAGRIQILPGAGITARNMDRIISETGCDQIHLAAHKTQSDTSVNNNRAIYYGGALSPRGPLQGHRQRLHRRYGGPSARLICRKCPAFPAKFNVRPKIGPDVFCFHSCRNSRKRSIIPVFRRILTPLESCERRHRYAASSSALVSAGPGRYPVLGVRTDPRPGRTR